MDYDKLWEERREAIREDAIERIRRKLESMPTIKVLEVQEHIEKECPDLPEVNDE